MEDSNLRETRLLSGDRTGKYQVSGEQGEAERCILYEGLTGASLIMVLNSWVRGDDAPYWNRKCAYVPDLLPPLPGKTVSDSSSGAVFSVLRAAANRSVNRRSMPGSRRPCLASLAGVVRCV